MSAAQDILSPEAVTGAHGSSLQRFVGRHCVATLILGDSETMERIEADALVSDPPYGIDFTQRTTGAKILGDDKPFDPARWLNYPIVILWGANEYRKRLPDGGAWYVWLKRAVEIAAPKSYGDCEIAWCSVEGPIKCVRHISDGCIRQGEEHGIVRLHPSQKPVRVMAWAMQQAKLQPGCTVLDPYMGSGSTGIACARLGMNFIGIERDAAHYKTACDRIAHELDGALL